MREALGPFVASLGQVRRRSNLILFAAALVVWGLITWSNYTDYRSQARAIEHAEEGRLQGDDVYRLTGGGFTCSPPTGAIPTPGQRQTLQCQLTSPDGRPIGEPFLMDEPGLEPGAKDPFIEAVEDQIAVLLPPLKAQLARQAVRLAPMVVLRDRAEAFGTFFGILFVVIITATFIGAEWRWGVWRTLLTHEPRRGRLLLTKLGALWVAVALGTIGLLAVTAGLDAIFRRISDVDTGGGPAVLTVARVTGRSLLSLELYATVAAALAMVFRTSFAGIGSLLFILGDGLATQRFKWLRHFLPTQQIATLMPGNLFTDRPGYVWWPRLESGAQTCRTVEPGAFECFPVPLKEIPHWRASLVLAAWIAAFVAIAWAVLRARDVPQ